MKKLSPEHIRIIGSIVVVALIFVGWHVITYQDKSYAPVYPLGIKVSTSPEISAAELRAFLKTWHKYQEDGMDKVGYRQFSMTAQNSAAKVNPRVARWLDRKGWNPDRFFYVEQRLLAILATIRRDEKIAHNNQMIKERLKTMKDKNLAAALQRLAANEAKKINVEQISPAERHMVETQMDDIMAILKMDAQSE